jgi:hypothetical protein
VCCVVEADVSHHPRGTKGPLPRRGSFLCSVARKDVYSQKVTGSPISPLRCLACVLTALTHRTAPSPGYLKHSKLDVSSYFSVALWICGSVALWLCGCVAVWLCGCVALWLCGSVALWLCGCVLRDCLVVCLANWQTGKLLPALCRYRLQGVDCRVHYMRNITQV